MAIGRRGFVKGATLGALAFTIGGIEVLMAPREARARNVPFRLLDARQGETLEALGVPAASGDRSGARAASLRAARTPASRSR